MDIEARLREWAENRPLIDTDSAIGFAEVNTLGRLIEDGGAPSGRSKSNGPIPGIVQRLANRMDIARRVYQIEECFALLPDDLMAVIIAEYLEGWGRPRICSNLNITESEARKRRAAAVGYMRAVIDLRPMEK